MPRQAIGPTWAGSAPRTAVRRLVLGEAADGTENSTRAPIFDGNRSSIILFYLLLKRTVGQS